MHRFNVQYFLCNVQTGVHSTDEDVQLCRVSTFIHSKGVCNKVFSGQLTNLISNRISAKAYTCKNPLFVWTQDVAHFHHAALQKLFLVNGRADLAISSATIKLAFTAASLCDFALVKNICCDYLLQLLLCIQVFQLIMMFCVLVPS